MPGPPGAQQTLPAGAESGGECPQSRDPGHHPPRGGQDGDRQGEDRDDRDHRDHLGDQLNNMVNKHPW